MCTVNFPHSNDEEGALGPEGRGREAACLNIGGTDNEQAVHFCLPPDRRSQCQQSGDETVQTLLGNSGSRNCSTSSSGTETTERGAPTKSTIYLAIFSAAETLRAPRQPP